MTATVMALDLDKLSAAKFRVAHDLPYLTAGLFALQVVAAPDLDSATMAVDDRLRLYVHPGFVDEHAVPELAAVLAHEVLHVVLQHGARGAALGVASDDDAHLWNLAADAAINQVLATSQTRSGPPLPLPDPVLPEDLGFGETPEAGAEMMYLALRSRLQAAGAAGDGHAGVAAHGTDESSEGDAADHDCGSGAHGRHRPWEDAATDAGLVGMAPAEVELVRHRVAAAVLETARTNAGRGHGGLEYWAQQLLTPEVDWRVELRAQVRRGVGLTMGQVVPSYARPSRRGRATGGVILPGLRAPVPNVAVIVDTSGSMRPEDLDAAIGELAGILRSGSARNRRVRVWACDTEAVEVGLRCGLAGARFTGGGGTALTAGFAAAAGRRGWQPDVIVVLTDGGTEWPDHPPRASVVVGLVGPEAIDSAPAWARTVRIHEEGTY